MRKIKHVPVVVIGTGISGLFTALKLAFYGIQTLLVTKSTLDDSNSKYAQGGISAVLPQNTRDSLELHLQDTLIAGAGLCDEAACRSILAEGHSAIADLLEYGVPFDRNPDNELALTREAAHSIERILHAGGDATGLSVEMALIDQVHRSPLIEVMEYTQAVELLTEDGRCCGCRIVDSKEHAESVIYASHVVLATGGAGRLYSHTTNPGVATGDGLALAYKAGAQIENMEFIQFHPTAFYAEGKLQFLVTEALRGEGGILRDKDGQPFAKKYHPDGELAPRDIVTRSCFAEMQASGLPYVYLDITHLPAETIEHRFPNILRNCLQFGVDIRTDLIPVAPASHYTMGGIQVDIDGLSTVPSLYAVGEAACTGLHGANRLASNSLLECVVLARRAAHAIARENINVPQAVSEVSGFEPMARTLQFTTPLGITQALHSLHQVMWQHVGILRDEKGLKTARQFIDTQLALAKARQWGNYIPEGVNLINQLTVAQLITDAALCRKESVGAHMRTDQPTQRFQPIQTIGRVLQNA